MAPKRENIYGKWQEVSPSIARDVHGGRPARAWRRLERIVAREPLWADALELGFLRRAISLLIVYGEIPRAHRLIDAHECRRAATGGLAVDVTLQYRVLRLIVAYQSRQYDEAFRREAEIAWESILSIPWVYAARLALAYQRGDRGELLGLLRRSHRVPSPPGRLDPYDRGAVFRILAELYFYGAYPEKARTYARLGLRELSKDPCVDSQIIRLLTEGTWGARLTLDGRFEQAEAYLQGALAEALRLENPTLTAHFESELARTHADWGHAEPAGRFVASAIERLRRAKATPYRDYYLTCAHLLAANLDGEAGEAARAQRHLRLAGALLDRSDHRRLRGQLHRVTGQCLGLRRSAAHRSRALEAFALAERYFAARGLDDPLEQALLHISRGQLHLRWGQSELALEEALAALGCFGSNRPRTHFATLVYFQSQILACGRVPDGDGLYEEILRNLGTIASPVRLFKVLANLYLYTWDRDEHLELSVQHLRQVNNMAQVLDRETFHDLYERHLSQRVLRRTMARTFGLQPDPAEEPD